MSYHFIIFDLPMAQGWALHAWSVENEAIYQFSGVQRSSDGYVKQEIARISGKRN